MLLFAFITLSLAAFDKNFCVGYTQSGDKEIRNLCATSHLHNDGECVVPTPKMCAKMQDAGKLNGCDHVSGWKMVVLESLWWRVWLRRRLRRRVREVLYAGQASQCQKWHRPQLCTLHCLWSCQRCRDGRLPEHNMCEVDTNCAS